MTDPIRAALERLLSDIQALSDSSQGIDGLHLNGDCAPWVELLEGGHYSSWLGDAIAEARTALAHPEPSGEVSEPAHAGLISLALNREPWATWLQPGGSLESAHCELSDLLRAAIALDRSRRAAPPAEALAARPLLEQVARMGDRIGQHTVAEISTISDRAAAWLQDNPPGQPVAVEPRGCPAPGACSCVEPAPPAEGEVKDVSQLSDGYHTFAELYEHRHALMLAFMRAAPDLCWFSRRHADGELCFGDGGWFIVGAELPNSGTVSYHLPMRLWGLAEMAGAAELELGRPWDGHTAHDVVQRLTEWASSSHALAQPVPPAEGEVGELAEWLHNCANVRMDEGYERLAFKFARAADLLEQRHPAPVPVSERPWERDGWCDEQGRCWLRGKVEGDWRLLRPVNSGVPQLKYCFSHSLPFHALPLPAGEVQP
jgi:hypothetical protein